VIDAPILLAEDNPDDVLLTRRAFVNNGFTNEIIVLSDGEACLAALLPEDGSSPLLPAMVLLDINLPKIGGLEVLSRLRADERTRGLPVIMLTTSREPSDIANSYRLGANSFVRKPLSFAQFVAAVRIIGVYWLQINEPCPIVPDRR
jgi:two-component system, response regulator